MIQFKKLLIIKGQSMQFQNNNHSHFAACHISNIYTTNTNTINYWKLQANLLIKSEPHENLTSLVNNFTIRTYLSMHTLMLIQTCINIRVV